MNALKYSFQNVYIITPYVAFILMGQSMPITLTSFHAPAFGSKCLGHNSIQLTNVSPIVNNLLLHCLTNLNQIVSSSSHKLYPSCVIIHLIHWVSIFYHVPMLMNKRGCMMMYVLFLHLLQSSFSHDLGAIVCFVFFHTSDIQTC